MTDGSTKIKVLLFALALLVLFFVVSERLSGGGKSVLTATTMAQATTSTIPFVTSTIASTTSTTQVQVSTTTTLRPTMTSTSSTTTTLGLNEVDTDTAAGNVLLNHVLAVVTKTEMETEGNENFYVFTGTRSSVIGMSEYAETLKVWVAKVGGVITKTKMITQIELGCSSDGECVVGGPYGDTCTLKTVLPKIIFSDKQNEAQKCYLLSSCKCLGGFCRWEPREEFNNCIMKNIAGDLRA